MFRSNAHDLDRKKHLRSRFKAHLSEETMIHLRSGKHYSSKPYCMTQEQNEQYNITLAAAICLVTDFRNELPAMVQPAYASSMAYAETFHKHIFEELIAEDGCVAIRAYFGLDDSKKVRLIFVGVDKDNCDILPSQEFGDERENKIFEHGHRCPPFCGAGPLSPSS